MATLALSKMENTLVFAGTGRVIGARAGGGGGKIAAGKIDYINKLIMKY